MEEKQEITLRQSNILTESRYDFDLNEKRCLYLVIDKVRRTYVDNGRERGNYQNMYVDITNEQLKLVDRKTIKDAQESLIRLRKRDIIVDDEHRWMLTSFINWVEWDKDRGVWRVEVSSQIMPYLVDLVSHYTAFNLTAAISLKSKYSQRFYELCHQYKNHDGGKFHKTVDQLREMMMLGDGYKQVADIKKKIIDSAQKELKAAYEAKWCDVWFDYAQEGRGKSAMFHFFVHTRDGEEAQAQTAQSMIAQARYIADVLRKTYPTDPKFVKRANDRLAVNAELLQPLFDRVTELQKGFTGADFARFLRHILKYDFKIS